MVTINKGSGRILILEALKTKKNAFKIEKERNRERKKEEENLIIIINTLAKAQVTFIECMNTK